MKKTNTISKFSELVKLASKIKVNKKIDDSPSLSDMPFFKKKMETGAKIIVIGGLPK
jgi:hypothetical protein